MTVSMLVPHLYIAHNQSEFQALFGKRASVSMTGTLERFSLMRAFRDPASFPALPKNSQHPTIQLIDTVVPFIESRANLVARMNQVVTNLVIHPDMAELMEQTEDQGLRIRPMGQTGQAVPLPSAVKYKETSASIAAKVIYLIDFINSNIGFYSTQATQKQTTQLVMTQAGRFRDIGVAARETIAASASPLTPALAEALRTEFRMTNQELEQDIFDFVIADIANGRAQNLALAAMTLYVATLGRVNPEGMNQQRVPLASLVKNLI